MCQCALKQKKTSETNLTAHNYGSVIHKKNYPAYSTPELGDGLQLYRERLRNIVRCRRKEKYQNSHNEEKESGSVLKCKCEECDCSFSITFESFFKVFPPKFKCPPNRPKNQKLSFIDDPPYTDYSEFLSKLRFPEIKFLEKETSKTLTFNKATYNEDVDRTISYCRYQMPKWINGTKI